jgi:hypothetical protein
MSSVQSSPSILDWIMQAFWYIMTFIGGVASVLLAEVILNYFKKPKLIIEVIRKNDRLGFSVRVKLVKDVHVNMQ